MAKVAVVLALLAVVLNVGLWIRAWRDDHPKER